MPLKAFADLIGAPLQVSTYPIIYNLVNFEYSFRFLSEIFWLSKYVTPKRLKTRDARIIVYGNRPHPPALSAVFQLFLTNFLATTLISFTKLKFRQSFWGALCKYILIESKAISKKHFFHAWKCIISGLFCQSEFWDLLRKSCFMISKRLFFQNSLELLWDK